MDVAGFVAGALILAWIVGEVVTTTDPWEL